MPAQPSEELRPGSGGADDAEHGQREAPEGQGLPQTVGFPAGEMHSVSLLSNGRSFITCLSYNETLRK